MKAVFEKLRRAFLWYFLIKKRLLKKTGFLIILLSIPLLTVAFSHFAETEDAGFVTVALACDEGEDRQLCLDAIDEICESSDILYFFKAESPEAAREAVDKGKCDSAWIFCANVSERLDKFARGEETFLCTAYEKGENTLLTLSKEKVFPQFYGEIAYRIYEKWVDKTFGEGEVSAEEMAKVHENMAITGDFVRFEYANSDKAPEFEGSGYLTSTLRGLLSIVMLLCAFAAAMYFLSDDKRGIYAFLPRYGRFAVLAATVLAALTFSAVIITASLYFSGNYGELLSESLLMMAYILALTGFVCLLASVIPGVAAFCVTVPVLTAAALLVSPVFADFSRFRAVQLVFPSYHYLYGSAVPLLAIALVGGLCGGIIYSLRKD